MNNMTPEEKWDAMVEKLLGTPWSEIPDGEGNYERVVEIDDASAGRILYQSIYNGSADAGCELCSSSGQREARISACLSAAYAHDTDLSVLQAASNTNLMALKGQVNLKAFFTPVE